MSPSVVQAPVSTSRHLLVRLGAMEDRLAALSEQARHPSDVAELRSLRQRAALLRIQARALDADDAGVLRRLARRARRLLDRDP